MKTLKTFALAVAAAIAATFAGPTAFAGPAPDAPAPSIRVSYADLNLKQPAGRATLEHRIGRAVWRLCRMPVPNDITALSDYRGCRKAAWANSREQLASLYQRIDYAGSGSITVAVAQ